MGMRYNNSKILTMWLCNAMILLGFISGFAQEKHSGIRHFENGDYKQATRDLAAAIRTPEFKNDAVLWNYLGLSYHRVNKIKDAIKSFERAIELDPNRAVYRTNAAYSYLQNRQQKKARAAVDAAIELDPNSHVAYYIRGSMSFMEDVLSDAEADSERALSIEPRYAPAYRLATDVVMARLSYNLRNGEKLSANKSLLQKAVQLLETGITKTDDQNAKQQLMEHLSPMNAFYKYYTDSQSTSAALGNDPPLNVTPWKILNKPPAKFTEKARSEGTDGTVRIMVFLGADGKVGPTLVVKSLPNGLTEQAIEAAKKIRFEPKTVNGKPVSVIVTLEYGFNFY
jgi:TonB family protein